MRSTSRYIALGAVVAVAVVALSSGPAGAVYLKAYYDFEGDASTAYTDKVGTYNGNPLGAVSLVSAGSLGQVVNIPHTVTTYPLDSVDLPNGIASMTEGTISLWFNTADLAINGTGSQQLFGSSGGSNGGRRNMRVNPSGTLTSLVTASTSNTSIATVTAGSWHLALFSWKPNGLHWIYVDQTGKSISQGTVSGSSLESLGADVNSFSNPFKGQMDDVGIWNVQLSATQVKALYNLAVATEGGQALNYGAGKADALFGAFSSTSNVTLGVDQWSYMAPGTLPTGTAGSLTKVNDQWTLYLGTDAGMQLAVPEPASLALLLLVAGAFGLRRRS